MYISSAVASVNVVKEAIVHARDWGTVYCPAARGADRAICVVQDMQRICFITLATPRRGACLLGTRHVATQQDRTIPILFRLNACSSSATSCNSFEAKCLLSHECAAVFHCVTLSTYGCVYCNFRAHVLVSSGWFGMYDAH